MTYTSTGRQFPFSFVIILSVGKVVLGTLRVPGPSIPGRVEWREDYGSNNTDRTQVSSKKH